jgi:hypothetical protein
MASSAKFFAVILVLIGLTPGVCARGAESGARKRIGQSHPAANSAKEPDFGPQMVAYLEFLDSEAAELKYYLDGNEMPAADYRIAKDKLDIAREFAIRIVKKRAVDDVPELYVMREGELTQILPDGLVALKGKRAGTELDGVWIFHGTSRRSELFYILERIDSIRRAPGP